MKHRLPVLMRPRGMSARTPAAAESVATSLHSFRTASSTGPVSGFFAAAGFAGFGAAVAAAEGATASCIVCTALLMPHHHMPACLRCLTAPFNKIPAHVCANTRGKAVKRTSWAGLMGSGALMYLWSGFCSFRALCGLGRCDRIVCSFSCSSRSGTALHRCYLCRDKQA